MTIFTTFIGPWFVQKTIQSCVFFRVEYDEHLYENKCTVYEQTFISSHLWMLNLSGQFCLLIFRILCVYFSETLIFLNNCLIRFFFPEAASDKPWSRKKSLGVLRILSGWVSQLHEICPTECSSTDGSIETDVKDIGELISAGVSEFAGQKHRENFA